MNNDQFIKFVATCCGSIAIGGAIGDYASNHNQYATCAGAFIGLCTALGFLYLDFKKENHTNQDSIQPTESIETKIETKNSIDKDLKIEILDDLRSIDTILRQKAPNELLIAKARNLNQNLIVKLESL